MKPDLVAIRANIYLSQLLISLRKITMIVMTFLILLLILQHAGLLKKKKKLRQQEESCHSLTFFCLLVHNFSD